MTRTDIHKPSAIIPADYEYVAMEYIRTGDIMGDEWFLAEERRVLRAHREHTGGAYAGHEHGGSCMICGADAIYTVIFYHRPTNTYVRTGSDCAAKLDMGDPAAFKRFRDMVSAAREAKAGKLKAQGLLAEAGLSAAWDVYNDESPYHELGYEERTIKDIINKLVRYGSISEKQSAFVGKLLKQIPQREAREAEREREHEAAKPAPSGRIRELVEVLSVKLWDDEYGPGTRMVMTVKSIAGGWKAWGTAPGGVERGDTIKLAATFTPSDDDEKFAFFKRPRIIEEEPA